MSHCGPSTAKTALSLGLSRILLRTCTPLLAPPPVRRTWNFSSKSRYCFLLHRKVLNLRPFGVAPVRVPSLKVQYSMRPSQADRSGPMKPIFSPAVPGQVPPMHSMIARKHDKVSQRMMSSQRDAMLARTPTDRGPWACEYLLRLRGSHG